MSVSNSSEALEGVISGIWEFATEVAVDDVDCAARVLMALNPPVSHLSELGWETLTDDVFLSAAEATEWVNGFPQTPPAFVRDLADAAAVGSGETDVYLQGWAFGVSEAIRAAIPGYPERALMAMADRYGFTDATIHSSTIERAAAQGDRFIAVLERFRQAEVGA